MLWLLWAAGLLASFAPRPLGLTVLRVVAPVAVVLAIAAAPTAGPLNGLLAVAGTAVAAGLAFTPAVGYRFVNGAAYGEERRFPLRVPPALLLGPLPLAVALTAAGVSAGPLLLADESYVAGASLWWWPCRWCGRPGVPSTPSRSGGPCSYPQASC